MIDVRYPLPGEGHEHLCRHCGEPVMCWLECGVERIDGTLLGGCTICDKGECQKLDEEDDHV